MKKSILLLAVLPLLFSGCNDDENKEFDTLTNKISILQNEIDSIRNINSEYIEIPFSKLVMLFNLDSLKFNSSIRELGFESESNFIYFKNGFNPSTKGIGVGHFMFHDIPMVLKHYEPGRLICTFPIEKLAYYKTAILEKGKFTELYEQESKYIDIYNTNYIREVYIDRISKLEYQLGYYGSYASITIMDRDY
jgi:hypothetical protein